MVELEKRTLGQRALYWLIIAIIMAVGTTAIWGTYTWSNRPKCYACSHSRHQHRMCGFTNDYSGGTCICEKDR